MLLDVLQCQAVLLQQRHAQLVKRRHVVHKQLAHQRQRRSRQVANMPAQLQVGIPAVEEQKRIKVDSENVLPVLAHQVVHRGDVVPFGVRSVPDIPRLKISWLQNSLALKQTVGLHGWCWCWCWCWCCCWCFDFANSCLNSKAFIQIMKWLEWLNGLTTHICCASNNQPTGLATKPQTVATKPPNKQLT